MPFVNTVKKSNQSHNHLKEKRFLKRLFVPNQLRVLKVKKLTDLQLTFQTNYALEQNRSDNV